MRLNLFLIIATLCVSSYFEGHSQSKITFYSDTTYVLDVFKPIDGNYNSLYASKKLILSSEKPTEISIAIDDYAFIHFKGADDSKFDLLLVGDDDIQVNYQEGRFYFEGDNAAGQTFLKEQYNKGSLAHLIELINPIFDAYKNNDLVIEDMENELEEIKRANYKEKLDKLLHEKEITPAFKEKLTTDLEYGYYNVLDALLTNLLRGRIIKRDLKTSERDMIFKYMDNHMLDSEFINQETLKYPYASFLTDYYALRYRSLTQDEKDKLTQGHDIDTFGKWAFILFAPESLQVALFGKIAMQQLIFMYDYFDLNKMLGFLSDKKPDSEYITTIHQIVEKSKEKEQVWSEEREQKVIFLDTDDINSVAALSNQPGIQGNYAFVDLWATWCMPCIMEFKHHEKLSELLEDYDTIVNVFISIDKEHLDDEWRKRVDGFQLSGFNLRASEEFKKDLNEKVYAGEGMQSIPRYFLLSPDGKVLHKNLPRPSRINELEKVLDELIK